MTQDTDQINIAPGSSVQEVKEKCLICGGIGYVINKDGSARECKCKRDTYKQGVLGRFWDVDIMTAKPIGKCQEQHLKKIQAKPNGNYIMWGQVRTGKTHFMAGLYNWYFDNVSHAVKWHREKDIKDSLQAGLIDKVPTIRDMVKTGTVGKVFIEDLGKVEISTSYAQELYEFIDEIYIRKCGLCMTTVWSLEKLLSIYGASIIRRLEDVVDDVLEFK